MNIEQIIKKIEKEQDKQMRSKLLLELLADISDSNKINEKELINLKLELQKLNSKEIKVERTEIRFPEIMRTIVENIPAEMQIKKPNWFEFPKPIEQKEIDYSKIVEPLLSALNDLKIILLAQKKESVKPQVLPHFGGRGTGSQTFYHDLTSQCDGNTKIFTIPSNQRVLGVYSTQFPVNYRPNIDWIVSGAGNTTLTLTDEVAAPETGQTLYIIYVEI